MLRTIDRVPTKALSNGAVRYGIYDDKGALIRYEYIKREDEPSVQGDAINRALFEDFLDVGTIVQTDADLSNDDRFLPCNGIFLQQDEYPELYGKIGYKYGGGDAVGGYGVGSSFDSASNCAVQIGLYNDYESTIITGDFDSFAVLRGYELFDNEKNILRIGTNNESIELLDGIINKSFENYGVVLEDKVVLGATIFKGLLLASLVAGIYSCNLNESSKTWTLRLSATKGSSAYFAQTDSMVVALVNDGTNWYIYSSTNGTNWTKRLTYANTKNYTYVDVKCKNDVFLARIADKIYRSTDGITWTDVTPANITLTGSGHLIATHKHFVFLYGGINYSEDGITWLNKALPTGVSSLYSRKVLGSLMTSNGVFYDIDGGFRIPFAKGRWIKVK